MKENRKYSTIKMRKLVVENKREILRAKPQTMREWEVNSITVNEKS